MTAKDRVLVEAPDWTEEQAVAALDAANRSERGRREEIDRAIVAGYERHPAERPDGTVRALAEASIRAEPW